MNAMVCFSNTFLQVNAISNQVWKFQRYSLVIEYELRPILPPPLIILCHVFLLVKYIHRSCKGQREFGDNGLSECNSALWESMLITALIHLVLCLKRAGKTLDIEDGLLV